MADDAIELITRKSESQQRQKLWDYMREMSDQYDKDLKNNLKDPFELPAARALARLGAFIFAQIEKSYAESHCNHLHDHGITEITDAHKAGFMAIGLLFLQAVLAVGAVVIGCDPSKSAQAMAGGFTAGGQITSSVFGLERASNQGEIGALNAKNDLVKQRRENHTAQVNMHNRLEQNHADDEKQLKRQDNETKKSILGG
jgi:ABC-type nickel/cobalt efflux system permease component RcnA